MLRTGLTPLQFRERLPMLLQRHSRRHVAVTTLKEVVTALLLLLAVVLLLLVTVLLITQGEGVLRELWVVWRALMSELQAAVRQRSALYVAGRTLLIALTGALGVVGVYLLVSLLLDAWRTVRAWQRHKDLPEGARWRGMYAGRLRAWLGPAVLLLVGIIGLVGLLFWFVAADVRGLLAALGELLSGHLLWGVLLVAFGAYGRWLLKTYVGDIALYVTSDQKSAYYRTRKEIKGSCTALLRALLTDDGYDRVCVAGHSLGSIIAYDCLNQLSQEHRAGETFPQQKLGGLLTFGSPLDRVYYFFRDQVGEEQAVRAQLLSFLHATRRHPSERDYGPYCFTPYHVPFEAMRWVNVYSTTDPISSYLDYYRVDTQHDLAYANPFTAHNTYWHDERFYRIMTAWLRGSEHDPPNPLDVP